MNTPWRLCDSRAYIQAMKTGGTKRQLTLGEFIERVYDVYGKRRAAGVVRLALKAHLIELRHR